MEYDKNMTVDEAYDFVWDWIDTLSSVHSLTDDSGVLKRWRSVGMYLGMYRLELESNNDLYELGEEVDQLKMIRIRQQILDQMATVILKRVPDAE